MISVLEIKTAMVDKIKEKFPVSNGYKYYGVSVKEGQETPCFFTQILPTSSEQETTNTIDSGYLFTITYFQKKNDEVDQLEKVDTFKKMFTGKIAVGERFVQVNDFDFEYIGRDRNILQMSFSITFKDVIEKQTTAEEIKEVAIKTNNE